jgi:hypothetical protein
MVKSSVHIVDLKKQTQKRTFNWSSLYEAHKWAILKYSVKSQGYVVLGKGKSRRGTKAALGAVHVLILGLGPAWFEESLRCTHFKLCNFWPASYMLMKVQNVIIY